MAQYNAQHYFNFVPAHVSSTDEIRKHYPEFARELLRRREILLVQNEVARANLDEQIMTSPGDVGDESVIDTSADYFFKRATSHQEELIAVAAALDRIETGTYGMCQNCETDIAVERLEKLPFARHCVDCQSALERRNLKSVLNPYPKM